MIKNKLDSYSQIKEGGLWIKLNSQPKDVIISNSVPQNTYYSQRATYFSDDWTKIKSYKPKYIVWSIFESSGDSNSNYTKGLQNHMSELKAVNAIFMDKEQKQPMLVIFEFIS